MMTLAALLLAALLLAASAAAWGDIEKARAAVVRRRRKLVAAVAQRDRALLAMEERCRRVADETASRLGELETLRAEVAQAEQELRRIETAPRPMLLVFDKASLARERLWEVRVANPEFAARAPKAGGDDALAAGWRDGRVYLLGAGNAAEARDRCVARFPGHLGFQVLEAAPSRLHAR